MRKLSIVLLLLLVILPMMGQHRLSNGEKQRLVNYAQHFLVGQGFDPDKVPLRFEKATDNIVYLNNPETALFILLARDRVAPLLHERTLAFSMGSTKAEGVDDRGFEEIFQYYDSTLTKMYKRQIPSEKSVPRLRALSNVSALLKYTKWRQFRVTPPDQPSLAGSLTGCGPTAMAQVMRFYRYPTDLIDWSTTQPKYPFLSGDTLSITPLMLRLCQAAKAEYGIKGTSTSMESLREAMVRDFGYSSRMYHAFHKVPEREILRLVLDDVTHGRPSLLCGFNHIFVCDGVCGDFFHLNMGWGGNYDGWYRFITPRALSEMGSALDGALVNIVPADSSDSIYHSLTFEAPGSLASIPVERLQTMAHLKVTGPLNGADLSVLRHMAGSMMNDTVHSWHGRLYDLDLSDARIVYDSVYYYDYNASDTHFVASLGDKDYNFEHMTHREWMEIADTRAAHNEWYDIVEEEPSRRYRIYLKTEDNVVGHSLFYSCQNLRRLLLPRSATRIDRYVFYFCPMLESVSMPNSSITHYEREYYLPDGVEIVYYP